MKFLKLTQIYEYTPYNSTTNIIEVNRHKVLISQDEIKIIRENLGENTKCFITLKGGDINQDNSLYVEETIDQIEKQMHSLNFNDKMDKLLE